MTVDKPTSGWIVKEMIKVLGNSRTIQILQISEKRLKILADEGGYLTQPQLKRISDQTGNSLPRWYVEATARWAKTAKSRALVDSAREMWDQIDQRTTPWPHGMQAAPSKPSMRGSKRPSFRTNKSLAFRHAV